ncbi:transporter [filamentous cyanobacterium CCP2]|nr:transporter [filamentous cyanobacterium CCP2]
MIVAFSVLPYGSKSKQASRSLHHRPFHRSIHRPIHWVSRLGLLICIVITPVSGLAQEGEADPIAPPPASPVAEPIERGVFFADVLVRGLPVFQVGSLGDLSATERSELINRRIAGILSQTSSPGPVTVQLDEQRNIATLQVNNRVIVTVTQQDASDFNTSLEALAERWAEELEQALAPSNLAVDVAQRLESAVRQLVRSTLNNLPSFLGALVVIGLTWLVAMLVRRVAQLWAEQTEGDRSTEILIGRLGYGSVWVLGSIVALGILGLNFATLLGTLGLTSVAIGFSLKDVLSNYISGVILLAARPFRLNDEVVIGEYEGTVIQVKLRTTTIQTYDGRKVFIPNQSVFNRSIINNTASIARRSDVIVGIDYEANIDTAKQVIKAALDRVETVEAAPVPVVLVRELAASTVNLEVRFWVNSRRREFLQVTSQALQAIKESLQEAGIEMPSDIYTLTFRDLPDGLVAAKDEQAANDDRPVSNSNV